jgi:arylsulfatase
VNVILYVADALRADHCSCYGHHRETTPTVDELGADGLIVENCFTQATWTRAAAASLLTGCYPNTHKTETRSDALSGGVPYLPELFSESGFETLGVSAMANISTPTGFDRGFDDFVNLYRDDTLSEERTQTTPGQEKVPEEDAETMVYPRAEDINNVLLDWLAERPDSDCFVLVWSIDPHDPYDPPSDYEQFLDPDYDGPPELGRNRDTVTDVSEPWEFQRLRDLYDSEIRYMDSQLNELVEWLRDAGEYEDTTMVLTGDHGESFGERVWHGDPVKAHNTPPFDERLRVPLVVKPAKNVEDVFTNPDGFVEQIDISPSLLESCDISHSQMQGSPLDDDHRKEVVFSKTQQEETHVPYLSARSEERKLIEFDRPRLSLTHFWSHPRHWLRHWTRRRRWMYDLADDPEERRPQYGTERATELHQQLEEWRERTRVAGEKVSRAASQDDERVKAQLDALGYID